MDDIISDGEDDGHQVAKLKRARPFGKRSGSVVNVANLAGADFSKPTLRKVLKITV